MFKNLSFIGLYVVCQGVHDIEGVSPISDHEMGQPDFLQGFPGAPGYWQGHFPQPYQSWDPGEYAQVGVGQLTLLPSTMHIFF